MTTGNIIFNRKEVYLVLLHIFFGVLATVIPVCVPVLFVVVSFLYFFKYIRGDRQKVRLLIFLSYLVGLEILNRSVGATFLPYEIGKYIQIGFIVANLFIARTKFTSFIGILIILMLIPSPLLFPTDFIKHAVFNSLGILTLGFIIAFTAYQKISLANFVIILKAFLLPCIAFVTYITLKTPAYTELDFTLSSTVATSGGFGSNQVATLLGASLCFMVIMLDRKYYLGSRLITLGLIVYFTLRAFLTFSRGGVIGMALSILVSFILFRKIKPGSVIKLAILATSLVFIFIITNNITGGQLLLRYQGETSGTLSGGREKNLESISSGRNNYAQVDLEMFLDNIVFGVGPGNVQFLRYKYGLYDETAAHTEASRLLAENGVFGLVINLILLLWPVYIISNTRNRDIKFIKCILFLFAYSSTFHSAIRIGLIPFLYGLASMNIIDLDQQDQLRENEQ